MTSENTPPDDPVRGTDDLRRLAVETGDRFTTLLLDPTIDPTIDHTTFRCRYLAESSGTVKIGVSADPTRRLAALRGASTADLALLWHTEDGRDLERDLHERFADRRVRGEWFDFAGRDAVAEFAAAVRHQRSVHSPDSAMTSTDAPEDARTSRTSPLRAEGGVR
ncbi:GIY-YIG nuclease family protein [Saccharothrix sp. HUAS TT1]|uniref:GIY-YIG nuclease family protein n=1 Tax=unclassified Saccharothrix TaxID=2593673 RepID=UPI00345BDDFA